MSQINNILVPVEIDENAVPVVAWAALLARATSSHLTLLHVNEALEPIKTVLAFHKKEVPETSAMVEEWRSASNQMAQLELAHLAERFCAGVPVDTVLLEGHARRAIVAYLEHTPADLVIVGTQGKPWYQRPLLGSTAETVLRMLSLPVLIVHNTAAAQNPPGLKRLLCPTDFSDGSMAAEEWARLFAAHGAQEIILVHAVENPLLEVYEPDKAEVDLRRSKEEGQQQPSRSTQPFWDHAHRVAEANLTRLQQSFVGAHVQVELVIRDGPIAETILTVAREKTVDLIVMGTHGRTSMRHLLIGKETEKVVRTASCPVLAVPRRDSIMP